MNPSSGAASEFLADQPAMGTEGALRYGATPLRVCIIQPVIPAYRTPLFNALGDCDTIDLTVWAGLSSPGAPHTDDPSRFRSFSFHKAPTRRLGPFLSQPAQLSVRRGAFDVVVFSWNARYVELVPALILSRQACQGTVVWGHGVSPRGTRLHKAIRDRISSLADAILTYSTDVAAAIQERSSTPESVFAAPNAIDQSNIEAAKRWWASRPDELKRFQRERGLLQSKVFVFLSRLLPRKNATFLLQAFAQLVAEGRDVRLAVIGDGPERPQLELAARRFRVSERVLFAGAIYDEVEIAPWCLSAVACVVPSSIGLSLLHAFGYGLPVVASADGSGPELQALQDGENGIVIPPKDTRALASALRSLLDDAAQRTRLSRSAAATVLAGDFTLPVMVDGLRRVIEFAAHVRPPR